MRKVHMEEADEIVVAPVSGGSGAISSPHKEL